MDTSKYFQLRRKGSSKNNLKTVLCWDTFQDMECALRILETENEKLFQVKFTKHWRYDFHLIEDRILIEISGGPWSGRWA